MSVHWNPHGVPRRGRGFSWGEIRLALVGGAFAGLVYAMAAGGRSDAGLRVIDGDTFVQAGVRIRIADIDTPETNPPRCAYEAELGARATGRLRQLLAEGPFELQPIDRDEDRFGRKLRIVTRGGRSLGDTLVAEGLARRWTGRRRPWC